MLNFFLQSYSFKRIVIITVSFIVLIFILNKIFDRVWKFNTALQLSDLSSVYSPPKEYDNMNRIKLMLHTQDKIIIEGNRKFITLESGKDYDYFDTVKINFADGNSEFTNKIFLQFKFSESKDSIHVVVSKSEEKNVFWKQIFYSSVLIDEINEISTDHETFLVNEKILVQKDLLNNNDTIIRTALSEFNSESRNTNYYDCGSNSVLFKKICDQIKLPCRLTGLQGGNADEAGYNNRLGYPFHTINEVYSSKDKKWIAIDLTYGFMFRIGKSYLNAVELNNKFLFMQEGEIIQDSILFTKRSLVGRDYFKFYENIYYDKNERQGFLAKKILDHFYAKYNSSFYHYSNNLLPLKNGFSYLGIKSIFYLILFILYINSVTAILFRRLFAVKKTK